MTEFTEPHARFRWMIVLSDLDYFKLVNDVLAYEFDDATLTPIAQVLQASVRYDDKVYRLGGDGFVAIIPVMPGKEEDSFRAITQRFQARLDEARTVSRIRSIARDRRQFCPWSIHRYAIIDRRLYSDRSGHYAKSKKCQRGKKCQS